MSDHPESAAFAATAAPPAAARAAKFERERLIVDYLNRGVSVAEIAKRVDVGEKRMRAIVREILDRRMPAPPEEFVAIQVSRLNEALLVAYGAMSPANLKAVEQVVRIVRELDRYHGFGPGRRLAEPRPRTADRRLEPPAEAVPGFGAALICRAEFAIDACETTGFRPMIASSPEGEGVAPREDAALRVLGDGQPASPRQTPPAPDSRPEIPPQDFENVESAPGLATASEGVGAPGVRPAASARPEDEQATPPAPAPVDMSRDRTAGGVLAGDLLRDALRYRARASMKSSGFARYAGPDLPSPDCLRGRAGRPEIPSQTAEIVESAPGQGAATASASPEAAVETAPASAIGARAPRFRMLLNGVAAC